MGVVHKAGYGTASTGEETSAVTGGRGAPNGARRPAPARTRTGHGRDAAARIPAAPAQHDRPWTRPRSPGAARTGGGPVVNASPTGVLSRSGPGGVTRRAGAEDPCVTVTVSPPLA